MWGDLYMQDVPQSKTVRQCSFYLILFQDKFLGFVIARISRHAFLNKTWAFWGAESGLFDLDLSTKHANPLVSRQITAHRLLANPSFFAWRGGLSTGHGTGRAPLFWNGAPLLHTIHWLNISCFPQQEHILPVSTSSWCDYFITEQSRVNIWFRTQVPTFKWSLQQITPWNIHRPQAAKLGYKWFLPCNDLCHSRCCIYLIFFLLW